MLTLIFYKIFGTSGANPVNQGSPGGGERGELLCFKPGRKYLVIFTSAAADNDINYTATWDEHIPLAE